ncbi:hypothetical protein ACFWUZ_20550 [Streptomyces sp. NPDC058646]|uniref:hypothetical protein n=1 Tax=Streptomyces sp. NPDC058646 TaxID=3346574 RepID=UPI0036665785
MTEHKTSRGADIKAGATGTADSGHIEAVFATLGVRDHDGDIVLPGAISEGPVIISDWNHTSWESARPIGRGNIKIVGDQARLEGQLFMDSEAGREAHAVLKGLADLAEFSWSLDDIQAHKGNDSQGRPTRYIDKVRVREVSPVLQGASINTRLLSLKSSHGEIDAATSAWLDQIKVKNIAEMLQRDLAQQAQQCEAHAVLKGARQRVAIAYSRVLPNSIPPAVKAAAKAAVTAYAPRLGMDPVTIDVRWFSEEPPDDGSGAFGPEHADFTSLRPLSGLCTPSLDPWLIWLNANLGEADAWAIAAHELRHLADGDETQARAYETQARTEWSNR